MCVKVCVYQRTHGLGGGGVINTIYTVYAEGVNGNVIWHVGKQIVRDGLRQRKYDTVDSIDSCNNVSHR